MGKYMRKAKVVVSGEVVAAAVMELAAAPLGVRTRARSLALQKRQGGEYLELRSRRLEKLPPPPPPPPRRRATAAAATADATAAESAEAEVSFGGENVLELEAMERNTRETTPCSLIRDPDTISTPGSTTRRSHSSSHCKVQTPVRCNIIPASAELEAFFAAEEQRQRQAFIDKYNFDPVNDCPLPGPFEWVKLD
ncbi:cyclin-dependent kinase inhibitor 4 [Oryza glaberrima]|uniref:Cyclin-dependent kinase inhibitor n=2 Tax=Oryza TaxID=4527 RepID=A0A0D3HEL9_9ORYZ|nr:cyclin-dependent kinase inhibitor 4 [Oryza glaberrima]